MQTHQITIELIIKLILEEEVLNSGFKIIVNVLQLLDLVLLQLLRIKGLLGVGDGVDIDVALFLGVDYQIVRASVWYINQLPLVLSWDLVNKL